VCCYGNPVINKHAQAFILPTVMQSHVKRVPCYHSMACPQVADRGDGLQIWSVAANILNKQSWTVNRGWPSSLGVGQGANSPPTIKLYVLQSIYKGLGNGQILWHDLSTRTWI
jgi:hypothetical protein